MKYQKELDDAAEMMVDIKKSFKKLSKKKHNKVDAVFHDLHEKAFEKINCLSCANCCKTTSPIFRAIDVKRIAKKLKMTDGEFERHYLRKDEDSDLVLKQTPCTFLSDDNSCSIYDYRPQACKEYPHTDRKRIISILDLTLRNVEICPAVADIAVQLPEKFI
ncbi:MAG: YkgJ family cysteine cluster protein [Flavobacteriales bacterium]